MLSEGLVATPKDPAVYVRNPRDRRDFVAGGFWVDKFIGIGSRKELGALNNGVDTKYGITGLGGGQLGPWYADRSHNFDFVRGFYQFDPDPFQTH
jgi:hypothetical protein